MNKVHNAKIPDFDIEFSKKFQMEIITENHNVSNYDELLRVTREGALVCKDKKKVDLPYYVRPFKLYINPAVPHNDLIQLPDWPALRSSR